MYTYVGVNSRLLEILEPEVAFQVYVCRRAYVYVCLCNAYVSKKSSQAGIRQQQQLGFGYRRQCCRHVTDGENKT